MHGSLSSAVSTHQRLCKLAMRCCVSSTAAHSTRRHAPCPNLAHSGCIAVDQPQQLDDGQRNCHQRVPLLPYVVVEHCRTDLLGLGLGCSILLLQPRLVLGVRHERLQRVALLQKPLQHQEEVRKARLRRLLELQRGQAPARGARIDGIVIIKAHKLPAMCTISHLPVPSRTAAARLLPRAKPHARRAHLYIASTFWWLVTYLTTSLACLTRGATQGSLPMSSSSRSRQCAVHGVTVMCGYNDCTMLHADTQLDALSVMTCKARSLVLKTYGQQHTPGLLRTAAHRPEATHNNPQISHTQQPRLHSATVEHCNRTCTTVSTPIFSIALISCSEMYCPVLASPLVSTAVTNSAWLQLTFKMLSSGLHDTKQAFLVLGRGIGRHHSPRLSPATLHAHLHSRIHNSKTAHTQRTRICTCWSCWTSRLTSG